MERGKRRLDCNENKVQFFEKGEIKANFPNAIFYLLTP